MLDLQVIEGLSICKQMFTNDLGILIPTQDSSFKEVKDSISLYEQASQAKLYLQKSRAILVRLDTAPQWLI